jgi:hypothetical protein
MCVHFAYLTEPINFFFATLAEIQSVPKVAVQRLHSCCIRHYFMYNQPQAEADSEDLPILFRFLCTVSNAHFTSHQHWSASKAFFLLKRDCNLGESICSISGTVMSWRSCVQVDGFRRFRRTSCICLYFCPECRGGRFVRNCRTMFLLQKFQLVVNYRPLLTCCQPDTLLIYF